MKFDVERQIRKGLDLLLAHRIVVLAVVLLIVCAAAAGLLNVSFTLDNRVYFDPSNAERLALEKLERDHGRYASAVLIVAPKSGTVLSPKALAAIDKAGRELSKDDRIVRVGSILTLPGVSADDEQAVARIEHVIDQEPRAAATLLSHDRKIAALIAQIRVGPDASEQLQAVRRIQDIRTDLQDEFPGFDFYLTGDALLDATFIEAILNDLIGLVPFQVTATAALLLVSLQSVVLTIVLFLVIGATVIVTMGLAGLLGMELNGATSAAPIILMGLCIATCIHLIFAWQRERRHGVDTEAALEIAIQRNAFPISLATVTTIFSFLCLNFSDAPPFRQLGNLIAVGTLLTWVWAFVLLPVLISYFPGAVGAGRSRFEERMSVFGAATVRYRVAIVVVFVVALALSLWGLSRLHFDDRFTHYFDDSFDFRVSTDLFESKLSGVDNIQFSIPATPGSTVWSRDYLQKIDQFKTWLQRQPHVDRVASVVDLVRQAARALPGHQDGSVPDHILMRRAFFVDLRHQLANGPTPGYLVTSDGERSLVTVTLRGVSSSDIRAFAKNAEDWLRRELPEQFAPAAGTPLISAYMGERNAKAMVVGTFVALVVVSLVMLLALGSLKLGLVSLIPNLIPMVLAFGFWGLVFGEASFAVTVVSAITFGLVVDGTIHFLSKYRYARATMKLPVEAAIPQSISTVGLAVLATSVALASGFATLAFSGFLVNRDLGLLSCIVLVAALLADLIFLPALLGLLDRRPRSTD